ncbi:MAG: hypothetical protein H0U59_07635 [Gemmatimonadaceae bacterium]|nr:hypothetical protein [Gemmatimonadaceae bacterium]
MTRTALSQPQPFGLSASFGFGDRIGLATPGHVEALKRQGGAEGGGILPIFAQQSIREMTRTNRTPAEVINDALRGAAAAGYTGKQCADADHLKTPQDVDRMAQAGFVFFTIDPSDHVDGDADSYTEIELAEKYSGVRAASAWIDEYRGKSIRLLTGTTITVDQRAAMRCAVKYGKAVDHALALAGHIDSVMNRLSKPYEIELSVDETPQPTTLAEHYIVADRCLKSGMKLVSLAPRFVGDFEKGVDFKGDLAAFEKSLLDQAALAKTIGPYKLSLHSGSDKLSIYSLFARHTKGLFHVKTAGTSYLEAIRVIARHNESLFRRIIDFARGRYETDRATYHVSATLDSTPAASDVLDVRELERIYLHAWSDVPAGTGFTHPARQILHTTFGSVLNDPIIRPEFYSTLRSHPDAYKEILADHFARHLRELQRF